MNWYKKWTLSISLISLYSDADKEPLKTKIFGVFRYSTFCSVKFKFKLLSYFVILTSIRGESGDESTDILTYKLPPTQLQLCLDFFSI